MALAQRTTAPMAWTSLTDVQEDMQALAQTRRFLRKQPRDNVASPQDAWSPAEKDRCQEYVKKWQKLNPSTRCPWEDLVCHLSDNPCSENGWTCWSAVSKSIPTIRRSSGLMAVPAAGRHFTMKELYISMGYPVVPTLADVGKVPVYSLDMRQYSNHRKALGNSFHVAQVGVVAMCSLALTQPRGSAFE